MCEAHSRDAAGSWETHDGQVPDSWLTEDQMAEKVARTLLEKGYYFCNELTNEEWVATAINMLPRMTLIAESNEIARINGLMD